jgi:hypothetical protein
MNHEKPKHFTKEELDKMEGVGPEQREACKRDLLSSSEEDIELFEGIARDRLPWYNVASQESFQEGKTIEQALQNLNRLAKEKLPSDKFAPKVEPQAEDKPKTEVSSEQELEKASIDTEQKLENDQLMEKLGAKINEAVLVTKVNDPQALENVQALWNNKLIPKIRGGVAEFGRDSKKLKEILLECFAEVEKYIAEHSI